MAVTLSSDLIMDVMRNADPARRNIAVTKLAAAGSPAGRQVAFEEAVETLETRPSLGSGPPLSLPFAEGGNDAKEAEAPYQGFERMVLRNLFETLLPDSESGAFGSGPSAGVWRSMAADQMAGVYASSGGVGIARMLEKEGGDTPARQGQWPYFSIGQINGFTG